MGRRAEMRPIKMGAGLSRKLSSRVIHSVGIMRVNEFKNCSREKDSHSVDLSFFLTLSIQLHPMPSSSDFKFHNLCGTVYKQGNVLFSGDSVISPVGNRVSVFDIIKLVVSSSLSLSLSQHLRVTGEIRLSVGS